MPASLPQGTFECTCNGGKLGLKTSTFPPERLFVSIVLKGSWADQARMQVGMEIFNVGGCAPNELTKDDFTAMLSNTRPLKFVVGPSMPSTTPLTVSGASGKAALTLATNSGAARTTSKDISLQLKYCVSNGLGGEHPLIGQGWLQKRGPRDNLKFARRWCTIQCGKLGYFVDDSYNEIKSDAVLTSSALVTPFSADDAPGDASKHRSDYPFGFVLDPEGSTGGKSRKLLYLDAGDADSLTSWIHAINRGARDPSLRRFPLPESAVSLRQLNSKAVSIHGNTRIPDVTDVGWMLLLNEPLKLRDGPHDQGVAPLQKAISGVSVVPSPDYFIGREEAIASAESRGVTELHYPTATGWLTVWWRIIVGGSVTATKKENCRIGADGKYDLEIDGYGADTNQAEPTEAGDSTPVGDFQRFVQRCRTIRQGGDRARGQEDPFPPPHEAWERPNQWITGESALDTTLTDNRAWPRTYPKGWKSTKQPGANTSEPDIFADKETPVDAETLCGSRAPEPPLSFDVGESAWPMLAVSVIANGEVNADTVASGPCNYKMRVMKIVNKLQEREEKLRENEKPVAPSSYTTMETKLNFVRIFIKAKRASIRELESGVQEPRVVNEDKADLSAKKPAGKAVDDPKNKNQKGSGKKGSKKKEDKKPPTGLSAEERKEMRKQRWLTTLPGFQEARRSAIKEVAEMATSEAKPPPISNTFADMAAILKKLADRPTLGCMTHVPMSQKRKVTCWSNKTAALQATLESAQSFVAKLGLRDFQAPEAEGGPAMVSRDRRSLLASAMEANTCPIFRATASMLYDLSLCPTGTLRYRQCIKMNRSARIFDDCGDAWASWAEKMDSFGSGTGEPSLVAASKRQSISSLQVFNGVRLQDLQALVEENRAWMEKAEYNAYLKKQQRKTMYDVCPELIIPATVCQERIVTLVEDDLPLLCSEEHGGILINDHDLTLHSGHRETVRLGGMDVPIGLTIHGKLVAGGPVRKHYWAQKHERSKAWKTLEFHGRDPSPLEEVAPIPAALAGSDDIGEHADRLKAEQLQNLKAGDNLVLRRGVSYIDVCAGEGPGFPLDSFASHFWGEETVDFVRALANHAEAVQGGRNIGSRVYYVCTFNNNQHRVELGSGWEDSPFNRALQYVAKMAKLQPRVPRDAVMVFDMDAQTLKRKWCVFEAWRCTELDLPLLLFCCDGEITPSSTSDVAKSVLRDVEEIDLAKAECSVRTDARMIDLAIEDSKGGRFAVVAKLRRRILSLISFMGSLAVSVDPMLGRRVDEVELTVTRAGDADKRMLTSDVARAMCSASAELGRRILLVAPAGAGKSVFSRLLVRFAVAANKEDGATVSLLPIRVPLAELAKVIRDMKKAAKLELGRLDHRQRVGQLRAQRGSVQQVRRASRRISLKEGAQENDALLAASKIAAERHRLENLDFSGIFEEWARRTFLKDADVVTSNDKSKRLLILDGFDEASDNRALIIGWLRSYLLKNPELMTLFTTRPSGLQFVLQSAIVKYVVPETGKLVISKDLVEGTAVDVSMPRTSERAIELYGGAKKKGTRRAKVEQAGKNEVIPRSYVFGKETQMSTTHEVQYMQDAELHPALYLTCRTQFPAVGDTLIFDDDPTNLFEVCAGELDKEDIPQPPALPTKFFVKRADGTGDACKEDAETSPFRHYVYVQVLRATPTVSQAGVAILQPGIYKNIELIQDPFEEFPNMELQLPATEVQPRTGGNAVVAEAKKAMEATGKFYAFSYTEDSEQGPSFYAHSLSQCRGKLVPSDKGTTTWLYDPAQNGGGVGAKVDIEVKSYGSVSDRIRSLKEAGRQSKDYSMTAEDMLSITVTSAGNGYARGSVCRIPRHQIPLQNIDVLNKELEKVKPIIAKLEEQQKAKALQKDSASAELVAQLKCSRQRRYELEYTVNTLQQLTTRETIQAKGVHIEMEVLHTTDYVQLTTTPDSIDGKVKVPKELEGGRLSMMNFRDILVHELGFSHFEIGSLDSETAAAIVASVGGKDLASFINGETLKGWKPTELWDRPLMANLFGQFLQEQGVKVASEMSPSVAELFIFRFVAEKLIKQAGSVLSPDNSDEHVKRTCETLRELLEKVARRKMDKGERLFWRSDFRTKLPIFEEGSHGHLTMFEPQSGGEALQFYHLRIQELLAAEHWATMIKCGYTWTKAACMMADREQLLQTGLAPLKYLVQSTLAKSKNSAELTMDFCKEDYPRLARDVFRLFQKLELWLPKDLSKLSITLPKLERLPANEIAKACPKSLRYINFDFSRQDILGEHFAIIADALPSSLEEMVLSWKCDKRLHDLAPNLKQLTKLKYLNVTESRTKRPGGKYSLEQARNAFANFPLRQLVLDISNTNPDLCLESSLPDLEELSLTCQRCGLDTVPNFLDGLKSFTNLRRLCVDYRYIMHLPGGWLQQIGSKLPVTLQDLSWVCTGADDSDLCKLDLPSTLTQLALTFDYCTNLTNKGVATFAESGIPNSVQNMSLRFIRCKNVSNEGLVNFGKSWPDNLLQLCLDFTGCWKVGDDFLVTLGSCLPSRLQRFNLCVSKCFLISDVGVAGVCAKLPKTLRELDLDFSSVDQIGDQGLESIGAGLPASLDSLCLCCQRCSRIGDAGLAKLGSGLGKQFKKLTLQITKSTCISNAGLEGLGRGLPGTLQQLSLDFSDCVNIEAEGVMNLSTNMPKASTQTDTATTSRKRLPAPLEAIRLVFKRCPKVYSSDLVQFRQRLLPVEDAYETIKIDYSEKQLVGGEFSN